MTPKEKAQELIDKYLNVALLDKYESKQCALIAVEEIITNRERIKGIDKLYWQEVKQEIEKL